MGIFGSNIKRLTDKGDFEGLVKALSRGTASEAAEAIVALRDTKGLLEACSSAVKYDKKLDIQAAAIRALVARGASSLAVLIEGLSDANAEIRACSAQALVKVPDEKSLEPLLKVLNEGKPAIAYFNRGGVGVHDVYMMARSYAAEAIAAIGANKDSVQLFLNILKNKYDSYIFPGASIENNRLVKGNLIFYDGGLHSYRFRRSASLALARFQKTEVCDALADIVNGNYRSIINERTVKVFRFHDTQDNHFSIATGPDNGIGLFSEGQLMSSIIELCPELKTDIDERQIQKDKFDDEIVDIAAITLGLLGDKRAQNRCTEILNAKTSYGSRDSDIMFNYHYSPIPDFLTAFARKALETIKAKTGCQGPG